MSYIDGFVASVPDGRKADYIESVTRTATIFKEYGALRNVECWGNDVPDGKLTDLKRAVKAEPGETVVFGWVVWPSKEVRDAAGAKMQDDERWKTMDMPFDGKRMIWGGFDILLDIGAA